MSCSSRSPSSFSLCPIPLFVSVGCCLVYPLFCCSSHFSVYTSLLHRADCSSPLGFFICLSLFFLPMLCCFLRSTKGPRFPRVESAGVRASCRQRLGRGEGRQCRLHGQPVRAASVVIGAFVLPRFSFLCHVCVNCLLLLWIEVFDAPSPGSALLQLDYVLRLSSSRLSVALCTAYLLACCATS